MLVTACMQALNPRPPPPFQFIALGRRVRTCDAAQRKNHTASHSPRVTREGSRGARTEGWPMPSTGSDRPCTSFRLCVATPAPRRLRLRPRRLPPSHRHLRLRPPSMLPPHRPRRRSRPWRPGRRQLPAQPLTAQQCRQRHRRTGQDQRLQAPCPPRRPSLTTRLPWKPAEAAAAAVSCKRVYLRERQIATVCARLEGIWGEGVGDGERRGGGA